MIETRKCFGTTEFNINNGICKNCIFYDECKLVNPKVKKEKVKVQNGTKRYIDI